MPTPTPSEMTAIAITEPGGPKVLKPTKLLVPTPGEGEALIKVRAAGINRPDVFQRMGLYPPPPGAPDTPGLEVAGDVISLGPNVTNFSVGDRLCALVAGGGYAEYCIVQTAAALPIPQPINYVEAAGIPETFFTVWTNVFDLGALKEGESFLVHGGTSGIGTTAIMLAKAFGAKVFATAGTAEKCTAMTALGVDRAINYREEDFVSVLNDQTDGKGVDVILDMVGGDYIPRNLQALAVKGRLVFIAFLGGSRTEADFMQIMLKRLTVTGSTLRARPVSEKAEIAAKLVEKAWPLLENGSVKPQIYKTFPLVNAAEAHALMESSTHIGKIVLTCD